MDTCTIFLAAALERKCKSKLEYMMSSTRFLRPSPSLIFMNIAEDYSSGIVIQFEGSLLALLSNARPASSRLNSLAGEHCIYYERTSK
jgi:hypothetical protein